MLQDVIGLLGIANPQLALRWHEGGNLSEDASLPMRLAGSIAEWHAPAGGLFNQAFAARLTMPDGTTPSGPPWVLCLHPQVWLRLSRLYGVVLEARAVQTDRPQRPVPRYFAYHGTSNIGSGPKPGVVPPDGRLELTGGSISVHDDAGRPIDGAATVSAFMALMTAFPAIVTKNFSQATVPNVSNSQLGQFVSGLTTDEVRVRLLSLFGVPFTNGEAKLTNVTAVTAASGLYRLNNPTQPILVVTVPPNPTERLVVGPATFGTLDRTFTSQPLSLNMPLSQLRRDFLSLFVDDLNLHLRGREALVAPAAGADFIVPTFHDEDISLLLNGNQALAAAGQALAGAAGLSLVASPVIENDFEVATDPAAADWPVFPAGGDGTIAGRLENLALSAHFLAAPLDTRDVFLQMQVPDRSPGVPQLAPGTAVRVYNRKFLADAREGRGNGAGGVLDANRTAGFILINPFGLRKDEGLPANPTLLFDLIAANRSGAKRSFGLLGTNVEAPRALDAAETALASRGTNLFNTAPERGVSPAGLLGLPAPPLAGLPTITDLAAAVDIAISLGDETASPRVAPRLPTMTRNETVVAGRDAAGNWSAVVGGLWVRKDSRSGLHRLGSPGSPGGEEFFGASVRTRNGLFAQELARTALRRTRGIASRLTVLDQDARWTPTLVVAPAGTMSAALMQDIAPAADSPNLGFIPDTVLDSLPPDWTGVVNALNTLIPSNIAANAAVRNAINSLAASAKGLLLYSELRRELFTARRGRRDAVAVLRAALKAARELIYIETSAFSYTGYLDDNPSNPDNANDPADPNTDLVSLITGQLAVQPGLKVLIGVSKESPAGRGYETFAARAYARRKRAFDDLRAVDPARVTLFHLLGFPGRPLRLMHTVIVVDDMWLFVGSGSFTRRGLLFDGNLSVAMVDRQIEGGRSRAIRAFRRQLMEQHLAAVPVPGSPPQDFPSANRARIADVNESYFAFRDTLDQGGAGLIERLFDGVVTGQTPIPESAFPHRDLADPDGSTFPITSAALFQLFAGLGEAEA
jgi:hypothetical protein